MSTLVICLVVVVAAFVVVTRSYDASQTATDERAANREAAPPAVEAQADEAPGRRPRHFARAAPPGRARSVYATDDVWADDPAAMARQRSRREPASAEVSIVRRVRSGALLLLLLAAMGTAAALAVGFVVVAVVTALRTAIG